MWLLLCLHVRNLELARLRAAAEERAALSEARCAAVEQAFAAYREQVRELLVT
jgi:hypothetical protein